MLALNEVVLWKCGALEYRQRLYLCWGMLQPAQGGCVGGVLEDSCGEGDGDWDTGGPFQSSRPYPTHGVSSWSVVIPQQPLVRTPGSSSSCSRASVFGMVGLGVGLPGREPLFLLELPLAGAQGQLV